MHTAFNRSSATILTLSIVLALLFVLNYTAAQWTPAPASPPNDNVPAPINVGVQDQMKGTDSNAASPEGQRGRLGANEFIAFEKMRSDQYCDLSGNNCSSTVGGGGGGGDSQGMMKMIYDIDGPPGLSNWPDWIYCGKPYFFEGERLYKDSQTNGAWRVSFNGHGYRDNSVSCGTIQQVCEDGRCGFYDGSRPTVTPGIVCDAYGCS